MSYSLPENEDDRLETLRRLHIYGTSPERKFDQITDATRSALGIKYAAVNLIFADRQWTKAACGIDMGEAPREDSFCARAVASGDTLVIEDLTADEEFSENPFVTEPPHLRFYAGAPLIIEGAALGTLCVFDEEPRSLTEADRKLLEDLAGTTAELLEARLQNYQVRYLSAALEQVDEPVSIVESDPDNLTDMEVTWVNLSYAMSAPEGETPVGKSPWIFRELEEGSQARGEVQSALRESRRLRGETRTTRPASRSRSGGRSRSGNGGDSHNGKSQLPPGSSEEMPHVVAWLLAPVRDEKGQVTHWITVHRDITDQKIREEELEHKATRDPLTGLLNRSAIEARLRQAVDTGEKGGALLYLDLDEFKQVNDTYGHSAGDRLLTHVAGVLEGAVRQQDAVGRIGGDEFVVLLPPPVGQAVTDQIAGRIVKACSAPVSILGVELAARVSVGVAPNLKAYKTADSALETADAAMYEAKRSSEPVVVAAQPSSGQS